MNTDDIRARAARCHADAKFAGACLVADQSQIDRAHECTVERYPDADGEEYEALLVVALSDIVAIDVATDDRAAHEASPDAARRERRTAAFCAGKDWSSE